MFRYYRSDAAAAIEAGAGTRAALVGFGLDGSHGWERTHIDSLEATYNLLHAWLQTPLTFAKWDAKPSGKLRDFPSSEQPAPSERWVPLSRGDFESPARCRPGRTGRRRRHRRRLTMAPICTRMSMRSHVVRDHGRVDRPGYPAAGPES